MAAGLKFIKDHIKAIGNIQKITTSMKMISATKFLKAERNLTNARPIGLAVRHFYKLNPLAFDVKVIKVHLCTVTSDRGLCGSMISIICKYSRKILAKKEDDYKVICIGEKSRLNFAYDLSRLICLVFNGVGHKIPSFLDASIIADQVLKDEDFKYGRIVFARFINVMSYALDELPVYTAQIVAKAPELNFYEKDEHIGCYLEFSVAALFYYAISETYAVELSSRMNAMNNASKNAKAVNSRLKLQYNRLRQASVTKELIDIVCGAEVVAK